MPGPPAAAHILVVDDDPGVRELLRDCFEPEGYLVSEAKDGQELRSTLGRGRVDLVTLDLNLGGEDGFALARQIRAVQNIPIVMITGKGDTIDRVVGLELGADDYIVKPFHIREVLARVRAVLRRYHTGEERAEATPAPDPKAEAGDGTRTVRPPVPRASTGEERLVFDGWRLDVLRRQLVAAGGDVRELTTAEFDMLLMFARRPGRVLSRDNIMDLLKGHEWSPLDRSIDSLVARLRKKIESDSDAPQLIKTVRGVGYVFAGQVARQQP